MVINSISNKEFMEF